MGFRFVGGSDWAWGSHSWWPIPSGLHSSASGGLPPEPGAPRSRVCWPGDCGVRRAGWRSLTVRLTEGCHFLLGFAPPGRVPPAFAPTPALRGRPRQSPSLLPKSARAEELLPRIQISPGELRAVPRMRRGGGSRRGGGCGRLRDWRQQPCARDGE